MKHKFTHYTKLSEVQLSSDGSGSWVHALPLGEYKHPIHGTLKFDMDRIKRFADSVKNKVLGVDPDVDYDHKKDATKGNKAAGWVTDADAREDGLWLHVDWTEPARKALKDKEYRYFSSEYVDEMEDNQGNKLIDVLRGGALTNRPFMKNLVPINLSELDAEEPPAKENKMDREQLIALLGLSSDATDDQIKTAIKEAKDKKFDLSQSEVSVGEDGTIVVKHPDSESELTHTVAPKGTEQKGGEDAELEKLAQESPAVAAKLAELDTLRGTVKQLVEKDRVNEVTVQLSEVGKNASRTIAPAVRSKLSEVLVQLPKQLSDKIVEALDDVSGENGFVQLGEISGGNPNHGGHNGTNPVKQFTELVSEKQGEGDNAKTYLEALTLAATEDPDLYARYQDAVAAGVTLDD